MPKRLIPRRVRCGYQQTRLWLLDHLPAAILAEPWGFFMAILCVISGLPTVLQLSEPNAIQSLLPVPLVAGWGACLVFGGLAMLCGLTSIRRLPGNQHVVTRVPCYRLGMRLLSIASLVYAYAVGAQVGMEAAVLVAVLLLFAATCFVRLLTLGGR